MTSTKVRGLIIVATEPTLKDLDVNYRVAVSLAIKNPGEFKIGQVQCFDPDQHNVVDFQNRENALVRFTGVHNLPMHVFLSDSTAMKQFFSSTLDKYDTQGTTYSLLIAPIDAVQLLMDMNNVRLNAVVISAGMRTQIVSIQVTER